MLLILDLDGGAGKRSALLRRRIAQTGDDGVVDDWYDQIDFRRSLTGG